MIFNEWHYWKSNGKFLLSDESIKKLRSFDTFDDMINWLWFTDKPAARYFNTNKV